MNMETREKPAYELRASDFIPFTGMINHNKRSLSEKDKYPELFYTEKYTSNFLTTETILKTYNTIIFTGATLGTVGLIGLLFN
jgi:hypothetical protein